MRVTVFVSEQVLDAGLGRELEAAPLRGPVISAKLEAFLAARPDYDGPYPPQANIFLRRQEDSKIHVRIPKSIEDVFAAKIPGAGGASKLINAILKEIYFPRK